MPIGWSFLVEIINDDMYSRHDSNCNCYKIIKQQELVDGKAKCNKKDLVITLLQLKILHYFS